MHVLHTYANSRSVPYLTWFTERAEREKNVQYSFLLMYTERPPMIEEMEARGFPAQWIRYDQHKRKRGMLRVLPWLWWNIRRARPDVVHCNMFDDSVVGVLAAWLAGVKVRVVSKQSTGYHWYYARKWMWLDRLVNRLATDIIAISNESKQYLLEKERAPARKLRLVHNGIPPERFTKQDPAVIAQLKERFGIRPEHLVIGTVARFIPWKGYDLIVEAAHLFTRHHPEARFIFCGKGEQKEAIRRQVHEAGLDGQVIFAGWVERDQMASFYGMLDIYFHAALLEPFGLIYPEAMMNGVPVVSTATGAALDSIEDGQNGFLARERTPQALVEALERAVRSDRKAVGEAGKETAMHLFHFNVMWEGTMAVYRQALAR